MAFDIWFYLTWLDSLIKVLEQFVLSKSELIFTLLFNESWKTVFLPWIFSMVIKLSAGEIWTQFGRNKDRVFWYIGSQSSITWKVGVVWNKRWSLFEVFLEEKSSKVVNLFNLSMTVTQYIRKLCLYCGQIGFIFPRLKVLLPWKIFTEEKRSSNFLRKEDWK